MTAEFDWWLLILGLVVGAGLVWLILAELPRREADLGAEELDVEAAWIAAQLHDQDPRWDAAMVAAVLDQHRAYLKLPPPEEPPVTAPEGSAPEGSVPEGSAAPSGDRASAGPA